jgi:hypothetical protein
MYKNSVRTAQETHNFSTIKPNRLMLFRETIALYCENIEETQIYSAGGMQSFSVLKQAVHIVTTVTQKINTFQNKFILKIMLSYINAGQ